MMRKIIILTVLVLALIVFFCVSYGLESQQKLPKPERHEVEVRLVLVDVLVTKDGKFVTDLTKDDFELYEDEEQVPINSFELISFEERGMMAPKEVPEEKTSLGIPKRQFVVIFDGVCSWQRNLKEGSRKIVDELVALAKLGHEVMIVLLNEKKGLEVLQPFTVDEKLIRKALVMASGSIWLDRSEDALKMWEEVGFKMDEESGLIEKYSGGVHPVLEEEYLFFQRGRFEKTVGGIFAVSNMLKDLPGRKSILLISDGLPDLSSKTLGTKVTEATGGSKAMSAHLDIRRDVGTIRVFDPFNILEKKKIMSGEEIIQELIHFANTQNISIYALDPDTFSKYFITTTAEFGPREKMEALSFRGEEKIKRIQNLSWLSKDTGAVTLRGAEKYEKFYEVMSTDLAYYYQLSFYPKGKEADNKYHKIKVTVKRPDVDLRFRKGYTDYSEDEKEKILLVSAFYNPQLFKQLPFEAELVLFHRDSKKYEPWINIALPTKELFLQKEVIYGPKKFKLHVWIKDLERVEKSFGGQINIPLNVDSSFMDVIKSTDHLCFHYKGPEMNFGLKDYQAIFALFDPQTNDVGTWESLLSFPDFKDNQAVLMSCVLGSTASNQKKAKKPFSLSQEDGSLEYGQLKFFPSVANRFLRMEDASIFLQIYLPQGKMEEVQPKFKVSGEGRLPQQIPAELSAEDWNSKTRVWTAIFNLRLRSLIFGDYTLRVEIPVSGEALGKELKLIKLRY